MKLHLGCGKVIIPGWINVDKTPSTQGWENDPAVNTQVHNVDLTFRWPWEDASVRLITISHLLYCMSAAEKEHIIVQCHRVLCKSGVVRITDDDNEHPKSLYHKTLHHNSKERTSKLAIQNMLNRAGFRRVMHLDRTCTFSADPKILIDLHQDGPAIFFLEAIK